jgi:hypothetical protein
MKAAPVTLILLCVVLALYAVGSQMEHEEAQQQLTETCK